jgi:hypothetical protein
MNWSRSGASASAPSRRAQSSLEIIGRSFCVRSRPTPAFVHGDHLAGGEVISLVLNYSHLKYLAWLTAGQAFPPG